jgi:hypothetical protein
MESRWSILEMCNPKSTIPPSETLDIDLQVKRTLQVITEKPSSLSPPISRRSSQTQPATSSPGTMPLGTRSPKNATLQKLRMGLHSGTPAKRLGLSWCRQSILGSAAHVRARSGRPSAIRVDGWSAWCRRRAVEDALHKVAAAELPHRAGHRRAARPPTSEPSPRWQERRVEAGDLQETTRLQKASLLERNLWPDRISIPILHGQGEEDLLFLVSASLANAKNELREGKTPFATWADTRPLQDLLLALKLLLYMWIWHPRPTLHPPARAPAARAAGSGCDSQRGL